MYIRQYSKSETRTIFSGPAALAFPKWFHLLEVSSCFSELTHLGLGQVQVSKFNYSSILRIEN